MAEIADNKTVVIAPGEQIYIRDDTKGEINTLVGPFQVSLSGQERPVTFDAESRRFVLTAPEKAVQSVPFAGEGQYIVLANPVKTGKADGPVPGKKNSIVELSEGRRINIAGPVTFALWPGQHAEVVDGHNLRLNQYLVARVYNDDEAKANWSKAVIKKQAATPPTQNEHGSEQQSSENSGVDVAAEKVPDLTPGQLLIVRGTEVSFYIPPTGIEVLKIDDKYVQDAVTLERMEYCILLNENGGKRFERGPSVVFPEPTETFVTAQEESGTTRTRKFRAIELNKTSGIYVKVIAPYEEHGRTYEEGQELFITGAETPIYFPRAEHSLIKYGGKTIHYAVAIPVGSGRYVLDRETGVVRLAEGPTMLLPDPRTEVILRRTLPDGIVTLLYPGNQEALEHNRRLARQNQDEPIAGAAAFETRSRSIEGLSRKGLAANAMAPGNLEAYTSTSWVAENTASGYAGESTDRGTSFTPPRMITIDAKYDGAVQINVYKNYAVLIISTNGDRRVVQGPKSTLLQYDETPMRLEMSTGKPKNTDTLITTAYLQVQNNKVSDYVEVETEDGVKVLLKLSYRVNFTGEDPEKWFSVENYVKFLTDHMRSLLRSAVKSHKIQNFYVKGSAIIRDVILGEKKDKTTERAGHLFEENGMRVYDVEVLGLEIQDRTIASLLQTAQHDVLEQMLDQEKKKRDLEANTALENFNRAIATEKNKTRLETLQLSRKVTELEHQIELLTLKEADVVNMKTTEVSGNKQKAQLAVDQEVDALKAALEKARTEARVALDTLNQESKALLEAKALEAKEQVQSIMESISQAELARKRAIQDLELANDTAEQQLELEKEVAVTAAIRARMEAISPDLIAALHAHGDGELLERMSENFNILSMIKGTNLTETVSGIMSGSGLDKVIQNAATRRAGTRT